MDKRSQWVIYRGRVYVVLGTLCLFVAIFIPNQIPEGLAALVVGFGVGFISLAIPRRVWKKFPQWFSRDDSWL